MGVAKGSNIQVNITKTVKIIKRPTARNIDSGKVCIYKHEREAVGSSDTVTIEVQDEDGVVVRSKTYTGEKFHKSLFTGEKRTKSGQVIKFTMIKA